MVLIKKSFNNTNVHNGDLTIKGVFKADTLEFEDNSINPSAIGTTADSIQKLNEATGPGSDILNTSNTAQTKFGALEIVSDVINNREAIKIRSPYSQSTGDECGLKFESDETDDITLYKNSTGLLLFKENSGDTIRFNDKIELFEATGNFKIGNTILDNNSLTIGSDNKTLTMNGTSAILDLQNTSFTSILFSGFRIEKNESDPTKLKITNGNGSQTLFEIDNNGGVGLGGNSPSNQLVLNLPDNKGALRLPHYTTSQRDNLTAVQGMMIYNSTLQSAQSYNGSTWSDAHLHEDITSAHGTTSDIMGVNDAQVMRNKTLDGSNTINDGALSNNIPRLNANNTFTNGNRVQGVSEYFILKSLGGIYNNCSFLTSQGFEWLKASNLNNLVTFTSQVNFDLPINVAGVAAKDVTETLSNKTLNSANCVVPHLCLDRTVLLNNQNDINNPTTGSDISLGYTENSLWHNSITNKHFICSDRTANNAIWHEIIDESSVQTLTNKTLSTGCVINTNQNITTSANLQGNTANLGGLNITSTTLSNAVGDITLNPESNVNIQGDLEINGVRVLTSRGASVANATNGTDVVDRLNDLLSRLRAHGLIET